MPLSPMETLPFQTPHRTANTKQGEELARETRKRVGRENLSGPVLRDTARLSQRPPYCALWGFWCLNMANWVRYPLPLF